MNPTTIYLTERDCHLLRDLIERHIHERRGRDRLAFQRLAEELARATVLPAEQIPGDVVTMNTRLKVRDMSTRRESEVTLSWPAEADPDRSRISVLAPLGMAMLGCRRGQTVEWPVPDGTCTLRIEDVLYQPQATALPASPREAGGEARCDIPERTSP